MLIYHQVATLFCNEFENYTFEITPTSPMEQWVNVLAGDSTDTKPSREPLMTKFNDNLCMISVKRNTFSLILLKCTYSL